MIRLCSKGWLPFKKFAKIEVFLKKLLKFSCLVCALNLFVVAFLRIRRVFPQSYQ